MQKLILSVTIMVIGVTMPLNAAVLKRPAYIQCESDEECKAGHCCTIGPERFSFPECKPFQEDGDICRPGANSTLNTTLFYPDGTSVKLNDVHRMFCPCTYGLSCDQNGYVGICRDSSQKEGFNHLLGENSTDED